MGAANRVALSIMDAFGDDQQIVRMLIEMLVRFSKKRERGRVPDNLVDPNDGGVESVAIVIIIVKSEAGGQFDQENRVAVDRGRINRTIKRNGETRLRIEPIELVQQRNVGAVRGVGRTVRQGQTHAQAGVLVMVHDSKAVAGER